MQHLFTETEVIELRKNKYTSTVSPKSIRFTLAFKQKFMELYNQGKGAKQIFIDLEYDPKILGQTRIDSTSRHIRAEANSKYGLHEGSASRSNKKYDLQNQVLTDKQTIACLKQEVILLRQELDLLKKIIDAETKKN